MISKYARTVLIVAETSWREHARDAFIIFTIVIQPVMIALMGLYILREKSAGAAIFVVVGSGMTGLWSSLLFISGNSITKERWSGTLESLVGMPTPLYVIVFGRNLANVVQSLISMVGSYALAAILFNYHLEIEQPVLFLISLFFTVISFICFGLIIAPAFILNPSVQSFQNALEFPVFVLGGFLFPIALLPDWTTPLSYLLTPYWAARALHGSSDGGADVGEIVFCWAMLLISAAIYLSISRWLFRVILDKTRRDATLGLQ